MNQDKFVSASAILRSITTLVNAGYIINTNIQMEGDVFISMKIPADLIQRKKKLKK